MVGGFSDNELNFFDIVKSGCCNSSFAGGLSCPLGSRQRSMRSRIAGEMFSGIGGG